MPNGQTDGQTSNGQMEGRLYNYVGTIIVKIPGSNDKMSLGC